MLAPVTPPPVDARRRARAAPTVTDEPAQVRSMFARIAGVYDLLNRLLSLGIDQRWRRALLERAGDVRGARVVDSCCGTGDVALVFARAGASVVGVDFTPEMLQHAERKKSALPAGAAPPAFAHGDALRLPVQPAAADVCTVAFGIRNVADRRGALREMARVVRPGGRVLVLEFTMPPGRVLGALYRFYFTRVLPGVGRLVSRDAEAYSYLPRTVLAWPSPRAFQDEMEQEGLVDCGHRLLTRGIACVHWGRVAGGRP
jgi:demethylmenaquinone methyltransferase/2-methoxy-6-polyprenyl-1,4-benzoquinol methylase